MNIFKRLAKVIVVIYAKHIYDNAVRDAERRHAKEHNMIYVASPPFKPDVLTTYDKYRFATEKHVFGYHARLLTLETLKQRCYYHTPDRIGNQKMTDEEIKLRRDAFIKERLRKARLI